LTKVENATSAWQIRLVQKQIAHDEVVSPPIAPKLLCRCLETSNPARSLSGHFAGFGWAKARPLGLLLAALLSASTGVLLLLTGLLLSSALLLAGLLLPSALLLLTRRALPALFLFVALILRNIFVWISHLSYLMLKSNKFHVTSNKFHVTMNQLITSYGDRVVLDKSFHSFFQSASRREPPSRNRT
jgi:hypothetical protein